ncbi:MBL fold metallo-hydrolase [Nigerium massiliense]|uniref:MBL fold metallo-hydrolase n=1 Tax=Nigerium massiliense TaxID=1522317 RepID=UPI00059127FF|nr:MBL fold metallo-hydrolase [Nigerium massiliense]
MSARIDHTVTSGTFSLDGETFDVDNNVWVVGDDAECLVIDAPHDPDAVMDVVGDRRVLAVICTHGHDDHVRYAPEVGRRAVAPVLLHPADLEVWHLTHADDPTGALTEGQEFRVGDATLRVLHTPGHSPGSVCLYSPELGVLFSGDTLFEGGPGATGRSFSDADVIVDSIKTRLFELPGGTVVKTGHGDDTTIDAERANV